jgi:hypothetical protein
MAKRATRKSPSTRRDQAAELVEQVLGFLGVQFPGAGGRVPCFVPFITTGSGVANIPPGGVPAGQLGRLLDASEASALRDAFATALRICRTNPNCPNPLLIAYIVIKIAVRPAPPQIVTDVVALWMCVNFQPPAQWWESEGAIKPPGGGGSSSVRSAGTRLKKSARQSRRATKT